MASSPPSATGVASPPPPYLPPDEEIRQKLTSLQVKIQVILLLTFAIFLTVLILGRLRSRGNSNMKLAATKLFIITGSLISFIPGLMNIAGNSNDLYIFWVAFMAFLAAVTNEISCYTLGDNEDRKKRLLIDYSVIWPLIFSSLYKNLASPDIMVPIVIIFWIVVLKLRERSRALSFACKSSDGFSRASKIVFDFQKDKQKFDGHNQRSDDDKQKSDYHNHLVGIIEAKKKWEEYQLDKIGESEDFDFSSSEIITLDHVRGTEGDKVLLGEKVRTELTNTCLSFSMFSLLLAKIAGYKVNVKTFKESHKLSSDSFELIEEELEFLYGYLFTNYYAIYERGIWKKFRDLLVVTLFFWLTIPLLLEYRSENYNVLYVLLFHRVLDNGYTRFVILAIIVIEYTQIGVFFTSKWAKVMYTCSYLGHHPSSTKRRFLRILIKIALFIPRPKLPFISRFSTRNIRQYSILESHSAIPLTMWCKCWIGSYIDVPSQGRTGYKEKKVPKEVQQAILDAITYSLKNREGVFSNGVFWLGKNVVEGNIISKYITDSDAISQTRTNLVWHIATTLLEKEKAPSAAADEKIHFTTATTISNYSAYLAVFFPQLLSDHVYTTRCDFENIVKQLKKEIYAEVGDEEASGTPLNNNSILGQARALVGDLENQSNLWKTLADFWTERFMFLALSDNSEAIEAHANSLCVGGEYITHVWALLLHAGCSK